MEKQKEDNINKNHLLTYYVLEGGFLMYNTLIYSIIYIFAIFGIMSFIKEIYYIITYKKILNDGIHLYILVKNQENKLEEFIRTFLFRVIYGKEEEINNITFVDLNSKDKTKSIIKQLSYEYDNINVIDIKNFIENFK